MSTAVDIPIGWCQCGCGERTTPSPSSREPRGIRKGDPARYIAGHNGRPFLQPGARFGRLVVVRSSHVDPRRGRYYVVACDCGAVDVKRGTELREGNARSCGCLMREVAAENGRKSAATSAATTHGDHGSALHKVWQGMKQRCSNPKGPSWRWYGGRPESDGGPVRVCHRWWVDYAAFRADMGERPDWATGGLDRIDRCGHYSCGKCDECVARGWPANVRWSTSGEQATNKRPRRATA